ncbi:MAG: response regulator [Steroidobacteraceae bacterium]
MRIEGRRTTRTDYLRRMRARSLAPVVQGALSESPGAGYRDRLRRMQRHFRSGRRGRHSDRAIVAFSCGRPGSRCKANGLFGCGGGYEATREIRARERGSQRIPIVALTANAMKKDEMECRQAGMDDHLAKPLDRDALERCLDLHLRTEDAA